MKIRFSYDRDKSKESGINLEKYQELKSVKALKEHLDSKGYYSIREYNKKMYATEGTTREKMTIQKKLRDFDIEDITGNLNDTLEFLIELKKEYQEECWGEILIDNDKHFWQGDYEGEDWTLLHEYKELDSDYEERMKIVDAIEKQIKTNEKRKQTKKDKKDYEKYLALKEKFEKEL